jgi:predicted nucleotidyltransferase component of viral defense system
VLSICSVRIDISTRESLIYRQISKNITPPYPDIMPYLINTMDPREIAAEKIRAILTRESARDLYDLYFLLRSRNLPKREDVEKKLEYYSKSFDMEEFVSAIDSYERIWDKEIESLTKQPIEYAQAREQVLKMIKKSEW